MSFQHGFSTYTANNQTTLLGWEFGDRKLFVHQVRIPIVGTGMIQKCSVTIEIPEQVIEAQSEQQRKQLITAAGEPVPPQEPSPFKPPVNIFLFDKLASIEKSPTAEAVLSASILTLQYMEQQPFPFPFVNNQLFYTHIPISPGMVYAAEPTASTEGGLHLWFCCDYQEPLKVDSFLRYSSFGT